MYFKYMCSFIYFFSLSTITHNRFWLTAGLLLILLSFQFINKKLFLCLQEFISSVLLLMQFLSDSSINNASFKHNLHVIVQCFNMIVILECRIFLCVHLSVKKCFLKTKETLIECASMHNL